MDVVKVLRPRTIGDLVAVEFDQNYCRERVALLAGSGAPRTVAAFALVAALLTGGAATAAAKAGNTGNGAISGVSADTNAPPGAYKVLFIEPNTNAGAFAVFKPGGQLDGEGVVGAAYDGTINFTIADGATDFVSGDEFTVTVAYTSQDGKFVAWDPTATTGAQNVGGINLVAATAPDGVDDVMDIMRRGPAIIRREEIVWPAGVTTAQKASAYAQLSALGILAKTSG